jgi:uncharacterized repeat protein (TIGR01451 family)
LYITVTAAFLLLLSAAPGGAAGPRAARKVTGTQTAKAAKGSLPSANFDIRVLGHKDLGRVVAAQPTVPFKPIPTRAEIAAQVQSMRQALNKLRQTAPGATARFSTATAAPEIVSAGRSPLSAAAPGRPGIDVVRDFLHANRVLYGLTDGEIDALHFIGESVSKSGLRMVRIDQRLNGLPIFQSETRFILDRDGRVWRSLGQLMPGAAAQALPAPSTLSAAQALTQAMKSVGIILDPALMHQVGTNASGTETRVVTPDASIGGDVKSELIYFPAGPGMLIPAWRQFTFTSGKHDWYTIVDATSGVLLWRKDMRNSVSTQQARFSVYVQADGKTPADSPAPHSPTNVVPGSGTQFPEIARTDVSMLTAQDVTASPDGWIPDGGSTTTGNNVDACVDRVSGGGETNVCDVGTIDNNGRPVGNPDANTNNRDFLGAAPRNYTYSPAPLAGNPDAGDDPTGTGAVQVQFRRGAVTQLFYVANWYHDQLYNLGFDEAAGNFQTTNFSGMGAGGDAVQADAQDSSGTDNANFATPPDGTPGRMQMYRFDFPTPNRDGDLDAEIMMHELTHGTSNRLIGNGSGLFWSPGGGMGEGWSDFVALSLLNNTNADNPDGEYASGAYATYQFLGLTDNYLYGIRRFPYTTDNSINPLTWAETDDVTADYSGGIPISPVGFEFNGGLEVHNIGEIWALTLWEVRSRVIADPAGANGDVPTGNHTMLQIVIDALKLTPLNPSYTDARDALILADCATNACANEKSIWAGFADRGLGYGAVAPLAQAGAFNLGNMSVGTSTALPHLDLSTSTVDDTLGNNNGAIDPGEPIRLTVELLNPWRGAGFNVPAGAVATLTSSTPGVTILDNTSTYPAIPANNVATGDTFLFTLSTSALCGQSLKLTVTTVSSLGTSSFDFTIRVGTPSGTGAPVTFTKTLNPGLDIPDGDPRGVFDTMTVSQDLEISDLNFRVDDLQHTFTGDLTIELRGPNGYGSDLIWLREILFGGGDGDNFIDTVIDDESVNDLNQSFATDAPFTGDWQPAFNSDIWFLFGDPAIFPDPVGQLSRYDGMSTQGDWTILMSDWAPADVGTLNAWSIIVTPTAFACTAFAPTAAVTGTKTVSGTFSVGGAITYTVTLTNNGTATQADNPGHEFTDVLPAGLTLVSASATSGTAVATVGTNTVTWDGSLALLGGSVTITINATVKAGTGGTTISNQGSISFDSDGNNTNDASAVTDDPGTVAANDPTTFAVAAAPVVTATKTESGTPAEGHNITYTVVLTNSGGAAQPDNPGNEFTDVLPSSLTLVSATATAGTAVATVGTNTVTWNGTIPAGGSVTITITATVKLGTAGQTISNQGSFTFDSNADGTNDTPGVTDDPGTGATGDPTSVVVAAAPVVEVPTLSEWGLALLCLALTGAALLLLRRRRTA